MIEIEHHEPDVESKPGLYEALDRALKQSSFAGSAAQAHGIASGLVCRNVGDAELDSVAATLNFDDATAHTALESLVEMSQRDLNQAEFGFDLWLPEADELSPLLEALSEWSQGLIIGLMYDGVDPRPRLSQEMQESFADIIEISSLEASADAGRDAEIAFVELREYLRMATQLIYEDLNPERPIDPAPET